MNIKEFELQNLKKETNGVLNGVIDLHIKALKRKRNKADMLELQTNMTNKNFRAFSPLKKNRLLMSSNDSNLLILEIPEPVVTRDAAFAVKRKIKDAPYQSFKANRMSSIFSKFQA